MDQNHAADRARASETATDVLSEPVRTWFCDRFPGGPTPAQTLAWPAVARGESFLLCSPTGTGKTLAAFLALLDVLLRDRERASLGDDLRCVYLSPLRSLGYDIGTNLEEPLLGISERLGLDLPPLRVGVRTGDTSAWSRKSQRDRPPHILITTPESLSLLLTQDRWREHFTNVTHLIVDEVHALVPTKRGADLAISLERVAALAAADPARIGLSATCRPAETAARYLMGVGRPCRILEASSPVGFETPEIEVVNLLEPGERSLRGRSYRRLLTSLAETIRGNRTTVVFANTRGYTEKLTHDLKLVLGEDEVAAHHSSLDAATRRRTETRLKEGRLRGVVTSTSLELGVDIGTADLTVLVSQPGSVSRTLQRIGRSGHRVGVRTRGRVLASSPAELAEAVVTARAVREGLLEPMRPVPAPLDVLCQQLVGMACTDDPEIEWAYQLVRRASPFASLERSDFDSCLAFLAGETPGPAGAIADSTSGQPRWTSPRLWKAHGKYGLSSQRVRRWFRSNVGTIASEDSIRVLVIGSDPAASSVVGTLDTVFAERLLPGDRFLLDGRSMEFRGREGPIVTARRSRGDSQLPVWKSDRSSMSAPLARQVADFREAAVERLREGVQVFATWLGQEYQLGSREIDVLGEHLESQDRLSEIPPPRGILVEETLEEDGWCYAFHAPLARAACEPIARAVTVRLGLSTRRDLALYVGDLGWTLRLPDELRLRRNELLALLRPDAFIEDVLQGIEHGELLSTRFRYIADTALLVLRNGDGRRMRVGGLNWVSQRLYPLIKAVCPDHPLLRETRREVLDDLFDTPTAQQWLESRPLVRFRTLAAASPFATAWLDYRRPEPVRFESPTEALRRLHARLASATSTSGTTAS